MREARKLRGLPQAMQRSATREAHLHARGMDSQYFFDHSTCVNLTDDHAYGDPNIANARLASHECGMQSNAIKLRHIALLTRLHGVRIPFSGP
jgi:hypothetical protein